MAEVAVPALEGEAAQENPTNAAFLIVGELPFTKKLLDQVRYLGTEVRLRL